jgi:prevent-host-death family protein
MNRIVIAYKTYNSYNSYMAKKVSTSQARAQFADIVNRAAYGGERTVLHRQKKPVAAVISYEEFEFLERMIEERENEIDVRLARKARKEKRLIPWEKVKRDLGL